MIGEAQAILVAIDDVKGYVYPTDAERAAAYELLVELSTRTSSAHLASTDDSIGDALDDMQQMFDLTRGILRTHGTDASKGSPGNLSLAVVAVRVLNEVIRPTLSRWRPLLADHEVRRTIEAPMMSSFEWEQRWDRGAQCRAELRSTRASIRAYIDTLGRIAGAPEIADAMLRLPKSSMLPRQQMSEASRAAINPSATPRKRMVRWLDLVEMVQIAFSHRAATKSVKAAERANPSAEAAAAPTFERDAVAGQDFWFDYVADLGDGFDGTAPVAWLVGREQLEIPHDRYSEHPTPPTAMPRGELMIFGGDEVYPFAADGSYESQTELPYRMGLEVPDSAAPSDREAALPPPSAGPSTTAVPLPASTTPNAGGEADHSMRSHTPALLAIPGNHDWLGGLHHFRKFFVDGDTFADHWSLPQSHPWWHAKLPQGWWLWGIDTALDNELVRGQKEYFNEAAKQLERGDRVILCSPVPLWQLRQKYRDSYASLRSTFDPLVKERGATMPLCLSGDSHFFAHYERLDVDFDEDHVTAGGGGAFLQPTHNLAERIPLEGGSAEFKLSSRWPLPADSRSLAPGVSNFLSRQYWPLMLLAGLLHLAFAGLVSLGADPAWEQRSGWRGALEWGLRSPWAFGFLVLVALACIPATKGNSQESKLTSGTRIYGLITGVAVGATLLFTEIIRRRFLPEEWYGYLLAAVLGGIATIMTFFLMQKWTNSRIKASDTLAFSPAASTRFKHFLRLRIDREGDLTCYAIGIDPVGKGWYDAMVNGDPVPPPDPDGIPQLHYLWGKTYRKFQPTPIRISVSVSDPGEDTVSPDRTFEQVCSTLIRGGHYLMYGGRPNEGYTKGLRDIEVARHAGNPEADRHLINYVAEYLWQGGDTDHEDDPLMRSIRVWREPHPDETTEIRECKDLTAMRRRMTVESDLRIVIGGALLPANPHQRIAPGIVEEAYLAVALDVPLIVVGGFGGAAGLLAEMMLGRRDPASLDRLARHFRTPEQDTERATPAPDFRAMVERFTSAGVLRNGLSDGENDALLRTSDPDTVQTLILRSVRRIGAHHAP